MRDRSSLSRYFFCSNHIGNIRKSFGFVDFEWQIFVVVGNDVLLVADQFYAVMIVCLVISSPNDMQAEQKAYKHTIVVVHNSWKLAENFGWMSINQYTYAKYNWSVSMNNMIQWGFSYISNTIYDERLKEILWKRWVRKFCYFKCKYTNYALERNFDAIR